MKTLLSLFICCTVYHFGYCQFWRYDGNIDILADSIELTILKEQGNNLILVEKHGNAKTRFKVKWLNDSTVQVKARSRNTSYFNENGEYKVKFMVIHSGELCFLKNDLETIDKCPQQFKPEKHDLGMINTNELSCITFKRDDRGRIRFIFDTQEDDLRMIKIKYGILKRL